MPPTKEMIEVMQAYEAGSKIECTNIYDMPYKWVYVPEPSWDWNRCIYRIKKEPRRVYVISYKYGGFSYSTCHETKDAAQLHVALLPGATVEYEFWAKEEV